MTDPTPTDPTVTVDPAATPTVSVEPAPPDPRVEKWYALRTLFKNRLISCSDCQKVQRDLITMMDLLIPPPLEEEPPKPKRSLQEGGNSTVTIIPATPSVAGAGQGREVAPGVIIIDPPKKTA